MRSGGILLPIFSLPSPYGIGTLGAEARRFVDFLQAAGQRYWQILPVCPTSYGDSPYASFSTFAGNPYFIDLDQLAQEGYLDRSDFVGAEWGGDPERVDYGLMYNKRFKVLRRAFGRFAKEPPQDYARFCEEKRDWLEDYALFMTLKDAHGGKPWWDWAAGLKMREPKALASFVARHREDLDFWKCLQYLFYCQWDALKRYANDRGILILGDMPIYVALDSSDVWANPGQFQLNAELDPVEVAGCPPDAFSEDGQLWGNPLFDWEAMEKDGFDWWLRRAAHHYSIYDMVRIDHFRGFEAYYAVPFGRENARVGRWREGPGLKFFQTLEREVGKHPIIAEDLGFITDGVRQLLEATGYPGMKVLEFAFGGGDAEYLPHNMKPNCVVYIGTHDNSPVLAWRKDFPEDAANAEAYLALTPEEGFNWGMMRGAWSSVADLAVVQMQDVLGLGEEARVNEPSTLGKNWQWRLTRDALTPRLAQKLREKMALYCRI